MITTFKIPLIFLVLICATPAALAETPTQTDDRQEDEKSIFQMTPSDVLRLRSAAAQHEQAQYREISNPEIGSQLVEIALTPEEPIQTINLLQRAPTVLTFLDVASTPWPVAAVKAYDGELFGVEVVDNTFGNAVVLHGALPAGVSFISVFLKDLPNPVTIRVLVGVDKYHSGKAFKVMKIGPETDLTVPTIHAAQQIGLPTDVDLNNVLFAVTPTGAQKIKADQANLQVWEKDGDILVRTNLVIFSPAHIRLKTGTNGYNAYRLPRTTRIYASNEFGKVINIALEGLQ